jgi:hypothetical protein
VTSELVTLLGDTEVGRVRRDRHGRLSLVYKYLGVGLKLGLLAFATLSWGGGISDEATVYSFAPAFTVRSKDETNYPMISVAFGYSGGRVRTSYSCDRGLYPNCDSYSQESHSGLYGSLTAPWGRCNEPDGSARRHESG